ncbi:MAG: hypothetical protein IPG58_01670 [Acidobacteria bacterium]|nr:hypothetical protein [Acidobacteriota bacterium]
MRSLVLFILLFNALGVYSQNSLEVYDISQKQLELMRKYKDMDAKDRGKIFADKIYTTYSQFWVGYLGNGDAVARWMNGAMNRLPEFETRNQAINGKQLIKQFRQVAKEMTKLTGHEPKGKWYVIYGPAWTDLGGIGDFAMVIDLSHASNSSNEKIMRMFPHELTHQIMTNVNKNKDNSAISPIIGEGFAVWMNQKYWGNKYTLAQNLGYTESELQACDKSIEALKKMFLANKYSTDKDVIEGFRNRAQKPAPTLPGAIGYYIGYKIVEAYVRKNGENSWRDIFVKSPREIYESSGF